MESREIKITAAALKHGNLYITSCGKDFFPKDVYGSSNKRGELGNPITLKVSGLGEIKTDIPRDGKTGKPRTIFRERSWVKEYVKKAGLKAGDIITICHLKNRTYEIDIKKGQLTFIDLFAGIGGIRLAFEKAGAKCVFSSEWDKFAQQTYEANFGEKPKGDIRKIKSNEIPDHDILLAGFPCQPFSISGVSKKNALGKPHGFDDLTQGTLFFEIKRILKDKKPSAFMLENVKNLKNHDKGKTYNIIFSTLQKLGYTVFEKIIDGSAYVPQHRERIYLVGFRDFTLFNFPEYQAKKKPKFRDILDENVPEKYTLTNHLWNYLQNYAKKHKANGNGFGFGMTNLDGVSRTLSARYHKDGSEILIPQGKSKNPRRLTPFECAKLMGFTKLKPDFKIPVSDTQAYRQFGNSVVVPVVYDIAKEIIKTLRRGIE